MSCSPSDSRSNKRTQKKPAKQENLFDIPANGPDYALEIADGAPQRLVAGTDEAGRGPLAGPVVAAAVILDPDNIPDGLDDSKQLSAANRLKLFKLILASADVAIASSGTNHIDQSDIRKASLDAMRRALNSLPRPPQFALIDGRDVPAGLNCPARAVIKGDARSVSIAAASIIAKVTRDSMMDRAANDFPAYGFERHAGYATKAHRQAISDHGACPLHRMSFRPLRRDSD